MTRRRDTASTPEDLEMTTPATAPEADDEGNDGKQDWKAWGVAKGTPTWLLAAARTHAGWAVGTRVDEQTFDAAVASAAGIEMASPTVRRSGKYGPQKVS